MTDRELLELAAKAAGVEYDETCTEHDYKFGLWLKIRGEPYEGQRRSWNPLTNDGDALRLSVRLNIGVSQYAGIAPGFVKAGENIGFSVVSEPYADDPFTATRRAIVRAAAELGKVIP